MQDEIKLNDVQQDKVPQNEDQLNDIQQNDIHQNYSQKCWEITFLLSVILLSDDSHSDNC